MEHVRYHTVGLSPSRHRLAAMTLAVEGGVLLVAVLLGMLLGPPLMSIMTIDMHSVLMGTGIGLGLMIVVFGVVDSRLGRSTALRQDLAQLAGLLQNVRVVDMLWISALAGAGEEALFRGVLLHHGAAWLGVPLAIALTSLLFGLLHAMSLAYVIFATTLGVFMCVVYLTTGNLAVAMIAHGVYDFVALVYVLRLRRTVTR